MDILKITKAFNRMIQAAESFQASLDQLPIGVRNQLVKDMNTPANWDPEYQPWAGLFPNPLWKDKY
jgi:hypothetical protein